MLTPVAGALFGAVCGWALASLQKAQKARPEQAPALLSIVIACYLQAFLGSMLSGRFRALRCHASILGPLQH